MLYKVQAVQRRVVPAPDNLPPGTWASDYAQSRRLKDTPFFTEEELARAWCQHMADRELRWHLSSDGCTAADSSSFFYITNVYSTVNPAAGSAEFGGWYKGR